MSRPAFALVRDRIVSYEDAFVDPLAGVVQYGLGCFEGVRAFRSPEGDLLVFRLDDHLRRLEESARVLRIELPAPRPRLAELIVELVAREGVEVGDVYVRPLAYKAGVSLGGVLDDMEDGFLTVATGIEGDVASPEPIDLCTSAWRRVSDAMIPPRAKISGLYVNSLLARSDAQWTGFDDAILLSHDGYVVEASGANLFLVRDGFLLTPSISDDILEGITRDTILALARDLGLPVAERRIRRSEVYAAQEAFVCGTGSNILPVRSVDRVPVGDGSVGPLTARLVERYAAAVRGQIPERAEWCTPVRG